MAFHLTQQIELLLPQWSESPLEHRFHEPVLRTEIVINGGQVDARLTDNGAQRRPGKPRIAEHLLRRFENSLAARTVRAPVPRGGREQDPRLCFHSRRDTFELNERFKRTFEYLRTEGILSSG